MIGNRVRYYSWVDIQDRLISELPQHPLPDGVKLELFSVGLYVYHIAEVSAESILAVLTRIFPNGVEKEGLELESLDQSHKRYLPIIFEEIEEEEARSLPRFQPSFSRPSVFSSSARLPQTQRANEDPVIITTHSFKGGVGRTLHAIVMALNLSNKSEAPILLIDADFEAPGITWMQSNPEVSFADFLNLVHSDPEPERAIELVAREIRNQREDNIFILPAFRTDHQLRSLEIKPEHIFRFHENPFILTDFVASLAQQLGVSHVIIDLRAGISELSSSWLLDPRVANVLVSTLSSQSVDGTTTVLELLSQNERKSGLTPSDPPALIVSQVAPERLHEMADIWKAENGENSNTQGRNMAHLRDAMAQYLAAAGFKADVQSPLAISQLYSELQVLSNDWQQIKQAISKTGIQDNVEEILASYLASSEQQQPITNIEEARNKLQQQANRLIYAEKEQGINDFYKSPAIRALAAKNRTRLPNLVSIGAKGAGKTFLFQQLRKAGNWEAFCSKVLGPQSDILSARIVKVTYPANLPPDQLSTDWIQVIKPTFADHQTEAWDLNRWRQHWLDVMAWSDGFQVGKPDSFKAYLNHLEENQEKVVFIFDGLEDLFPNYFQAEPPKKALRSLIQDVNQFIGVTPNSPIGMVIFLRGDIVRHVLPQNSGQFVDQFKEYSLRWDRTEALRLIAWVLTFYDIISLNLNLDDVPSRSYDQLTQDLRPLWGRKLGSDRSREALSAKYVLNSLSNFNDEIQSRDLMVFLNEAITIESQGTASAYDDRVLSPLSVRKSIPEVSKKKIVEIKEENKNNEFAAVLEKLENVADQLQVPFEQTDLLTAADLQILMQNGVLKLDRNKYYVAEIFRSGLNLKQGKGRAKTDFN